ncbi:hypothetical protein FA893_18255 [Photobacterium damselae subsp. piscicida]|uniref:hypothetical protein n=1 Tax=Photobacterium damselae TaxID=38293 RepID=UPI0002F6B6DA|nr:hypothetical protein [Photobacterium damselae]OLQ78687.1 hypothetical protein BEI67_18980 [Photobacterium damselae subsp. piscicida]TFZ63943.1 hypothetical protein E4T25_01380 [Photobacterium damselae subsp. piscicida]TJZ82344.1 hypothetical protein FA893_18255 [Photobacterium damselae subsp. piscicida]
MFVSINKKTSQDRTLSKDDVSTKAFGWKVKDVQWEEGTIRTLFNCDWMAGISGNTRKREEDVIAIQSLFIDIDDPCDVGDNLLNHVHENLKAHNVSHAIATSINHQKLKETKAGKVLPACPRIKVLIPLSDVIDTESDHAKLVWSESVPSIMEFLSNIIKVRREKNGEVIHPFDESCFQINRYSYRVNPSLPNFEWKFHDGEPLNINELAKEVDPTVTSAVTVGVTDGVTQCYRNDDDLLLSAATHFYSEPREHTEWCTVSYVIGSKFGIHQLRTMTSATEGQYLKFCKNKLGGRKADVGSVFMLAANYGWVRPKKQSVFDFDWSKASDW